MTDQHAETPEKEAPDGDIEAGVSDAEAEAGDTEAAAAEDASALDADFDALEEKIVERIKTVYDPEIPVNVYDLGLIYRITVNPDRTVMVLMTLTAPNCPAAGFLPGQVEQRIRTMDEVEDARVDITFDPPYHPDMMSEAAKLELGFL